MDFEFIVQKDHLQAYSRTVGYSGNVNSYCCVFRFDEAWDGMAKFLVVDMGDKEYLQTIIDGECYLAQEALAERNQIRLGVYGSIIENGEEYRRISTNMVILDIEEGAFRSASAPEEPQPEVWEQYVDAMQKAIDKNAPFIGESGCWMLWDAEQKAYYDSGLPARGEPGEKGEKGEKGNAPIRGTDYWTPEDEAKILADCEEILNQKADREEGKGLSQNDFTDEDKEHLEKLKGSYVFIGSYGDIRELPEDSAELNHFYVPVFNYIGEEITFTQPYNYNPYQITVLKIGCGEIYQGAERGYFEIPQNEAILFRPGTEIEMHMDGSAQSILDTVFRVDFLHEEEIGSLVAKVWLQNTKEFPDSFCYVTCHPTATFRCGDNVAIMEVGGKPFYEVLSHDYGGEMDRMQEQIQKKAEKQKAVPSTIKTGNPLVLSDQLAGERLLSFQIHGAEGGVGDLTDSGKYQIPIKLYGKNLVNSSIFAADFDLQEDGSYRANKIISTARKYSVFLPAGTYTISYIMKAPATSNYRISFVLADGTELNGYIKPSNGEYQHLTKTFTFASPVVSLYWGYGAPTSDVSFYDLQIEAGSIRTDYEPYHAYETKMVLVDAPLGAGETVAVDGMVARDGVSTYVTETSVSPILSIGYYQDINKVIAGLQAMILEA